MITTGGHVYRTPLSPGGGESDLLISPAFSSLSAPAGTQDDADISIPVPAANFDGPHLSPEGWLIGLVALAVVMHVIHRHSRKIAGVPIGRVEDALGINLWNFLNVTLLASLGILTLKVGANKFATGSTFASVANAI